MFSLSIIGKSRFTLSIIGSMGEFRENTEQNEQNLDQKHRKKYVSLSIIGRDHRMGKFREKILIKYST